MESLSFDCLVKRKLSYVEFSESLTGCVSISAFDAEANGEEEIISSCAILIEKHQARQLHEWLGRYLENSDG